MRNKLLTAMIRGTSENTTRISIGTMEQNITITKYLQEIVAISDVSVSRKS